MISVLRINEAPLDDLICKTDLVEQKTTSEFDLERMWKLDHIGISSTELDKDSKAALQNFNETVRYSATDQQYVVGLPWKSDCDKLPTNYGLALGRLRNLHHKLQKDQQLCEAYDQVFKTYLERGFIEEVEPSTHKETKVHYLAHHGVKKLSKTTPIRVVFDCSARANKGSPSLNDCLYTGPSMVSELSEILMRFRLGEYAFVSDIEKAYLMVQLKEEDRDVTRFLWIKDINNANSEVIKYRFKVVIFGATCSQFLLNATIHKHLKLVQEDTTQLVRGLYIDNLGGSCNNEEGLVDRYWQAQRLFIQAHLYLKEWVTNSKLLEEHIETDGVASDDQQVTRFLGMNWHTQENSLAFPERHCTSETNVHTKRSFLSAVAQMFDPLGFLLPVTIRARVLMQELWRRKLDWDSDIPSDIQEQCVKLLKEYVILCKLLRIPRMVTKEKRVDLHAFCDASTTAYGAAVYFVTSLGSKLVTARAKVAPIKPLTVPKMELTSMLLLARLVGHIHSAYQYELDIMSDHIWCDSQIALSWVNSNKTLPVYVRNRVDEIHTLLPRAKYHYLKSAENPSDLITRGITASKLLQSQLWWQGPVWLPQRENWIEWQAVNEVETASETVTMVVPLQKQTSEPFMQWEKYEGYNKTIRIVAWILRFITNIQNRLKGEPVNGGVILSTEEIIVAEVTVIKLVQREEYPLEYNYLNSSSTIKPPNLVYQLRLWLDEGLIRSKGRLKWSEVDPNTDNPILLPPKHPVTKKLIALVHKNVAHYGVNQVVTQLRQKWWIPRIRQTVRAILKNCVTCKKLKSKPYCTGLSPPLPEFRVKHTNPFQVTGLDYTGALQVREGENQGKVYILLFTCATSRALHLELCDSMTCEDFLLAFRRFCGRRSFPQLILSDNAPTFILAANHLATLQKDPAVIEYLGENRVEWKFIPARAPWFGAMWERCVGTVKSGLRAIVGRALLKREELHTVLVELEAIINDRPITYVYTDQNEPNPLTPSHLLYGRCLRSFPNNTLTQDELEDPSMYDKTSISKRYQYLIKIIQNVKKRWLHEYLISLRERLEQEPHVKRTWPKIGEIVLIHDEGPRLKWKMGKVIGLLTGKDKVDRVAQVKTSTGSTTRPIAKLYPIEMDIEEDRNHESEEEMNEPQVITPRVPRKARNAAAGAVRMWRQKIHSGQL